MHWQDGAGHEQASASRVTTVPALHQPVLVMIRLFLCVVLTAACLAEAVGQGSVVTPGPDHSLLVNGKPFFPLGWNALGTCSGVADDPTTLNRASVLADLELVRGLGTNTVLEHNQANGRIVPLALGPGWYNWVNYTDASPEGGPRQVGHPRPGAYVEGMRWLMDQARTGDRPVYVIVSLTGFLLPNAQGQPYNTADRIPCSAYRSLIEEERSRHAAVDARRAQRIPQVVCGGQPTRPLWEWHVWYVVQHLRDHPALLGWFLWDEPEGVTHRATFGIVQPGQPVPRYTGPASLPTPDFLRYAYRLVRTLETQNTPPGYQRHPIIVDVFTPEVFFSTRFPWSNADRLDPQWSSGPFDRTPEGGYHIPADIIGLEASAIFEHTAGQGTLPRVDWYLDVNYTSRRAEMIDDAVRTDGLWAGIVAAAQAQLPTAGPYAIAEPVRCPPNDALRTRYLNDRDLVWQLITPTINGLRGFLYYTYTLMPETGKGARQVARSNRLLEQFHTAQLDSVLLTPRLSTPEASLFIYSLTDYYREAPDFLGPATTFEPGVSPFTTTGRIPGAAYTVANYGRAADESAYGEATPDPYPSTHGAHRLLRIAHHRYRGADYVFLSNVFDARLDVNMLVDQADGQDAAAARVSEARFDLDADGGFRWAEAPARLIAFAQPSTQQMRLSFTLEPYEARVFRIAR